MKKEIDNMKYIVCCPLCDNIKCIKGENKCEAEIWAKKELKRHEVESEDTE